LRGGEPVAPTDKQGEVLPHRFWVAKNLERPQLGICLGDQSAVDFAGSLIPKLLNRTLVLHNCPWPRLGIWKGRSFGMAERSRPSYPRLSAKAWWVIRQRFQKSVPSAVSPGYLATLFNCAEASASSNYLRPLKIMGLVSEDNKVTDLGMRWRNDDEYQAVCEEIRKATYPAELRESQPCPNPDRVAVKNWFLRTTGQGSDATDQMTALYGLLCDASLDSHSVVAAKSKTAGHQNRATKSNASPSRSSRKTQGGETRDIVVESSSPDPNGKLETPSGSNQSTVIPSLHIDVQIHISPDASAEQIDQIFKSMATHLYRSEAPAGR
jgi:hypothetical protein